MIDEYLNSDIENVLLVQPDFPVYKRSTNHHEQLPIGLLKLASLFKKYGKEVELIRFNDKTETVTPDVICVTSIFTYWSAYVKDTVTHFRQKYPDVPILVGGVYASLMPEHCKEYTECTEVITGVIPEAEELEPAYDLVDVDFQIIHTTRGCIRNCNFCGVYTIEPSFEYKETIRDEIHKKRVIIYDNNFLANPHIEHILDELITLRREHKINYLESQSGFDGRLLLKNPLLAQKISMAGFKNVKIAWDGHVSDYYKIKKQLELLFIHGYKAKDISCFMVFNHDVNYADCEQKRCLLFRLGVKIVPCRYIPLTSISDGYNPHMKRQRNDEYYIHNGWKDKEIREFKRNCRKHNYCLRYDMKFYSKSVERKKLSKPEMKELCDLSFEEADSVLLDCWNPAVLHFA